MGLLSIMRRTTAKEARQKMPVKTTKSGRNGEADSDATINVVVSLTAKDHKAATLAASSSHEVLTEWISSLVHTALQP
jgi:hypothetical protein